MRERFAFRAPQDPMETTQPPHDFNTLSRIVEALTGLSTLSSVWDASDSRSIAEDLGLAVLRSLPVRFAYVCLHDQTGKGVELVRSHTGVEPDEKAKEIGELLQPLFHAENQVGTLDNPFGEGTLNVAIAPVGVMGDCGFLVAASDARFPSQADRVFLAAAANQAAVVLQHHEAEQALHASEQRFARFMQNLPGLAWIKDSEGRYVYANSGAEKAFRLSSDQLYGKTDEEVFPPETAARFRENDLVAIARPSGVQVIEALMHDDGVVHHSVVSKFPIPGKDGTLIGGIAFDITDRVQAEKTALEASRQKDAFFAVLGHELRNPLSPMLTALQLMRLRGIDGREVDILERQVTHMRRLVDDLLDVSRITLGKIELRRERVALDTIVRGAVEMSASMIDACRHRLEVALPPEPLTVHADPVRLTQALSNLLNNAAKYTGEGGQIWLSVTPRGEQVELSVRDNGAGIPVAMLERVFDMFVQLEGFDGSLRPGLGIGLTMVRLLVNLHNGQVEARSEGAGKGSEFIVRLPLDGRPEQAPQASRPAISAPAGCRRRMLLVDDNRDFADSLAALLTLSGAETEVAYDGASALAAIALRPPQVVLLDLGMSGMDGYAVANCIRRDPRYKDIRLVAITGWGQEQDRRRTMEAGFDYHLTKPVDPGVLQRLLDELERGPEVAARMPGPATA
jgi:PAS domain S-box-containing protein